MNSRSAPPFVMSNHLTHALSVARALAVGGSALQAASQLDRVSTLDVHGHHARERQLLQIVVLARVRRLEEAEALLRALGGLQPHELSDLSNMLAAVPEAAHSGYREWAQKLMRAAGMNPDKAGRGGVPVGAGGTRLMGATILAVLVVLAGMVAIYTLRKQPDPVDALATMIDSMESGDMVVLWDTLPQGYKSEADSAMQALVRFVPEKALEDDQLVYQAMSQIVQEKLPYLKGSHVESIGPYFRTAAGEENAGELATYLRQLSEAPLWRTEQLTDLTVHDVLGYVCKPPFSTCWRSYFRVEALSSELWPAIFGITPDEFRSLLFKKRVYAIAEGGAPTEQAVVAILLPQGGRVSVAMRLVDGKWIPEHIHDNWRLWMVSIQAAATRRDLSNQMLQQIQAEFDAKKSDERKLRLIDLYKARTQEEFDALARELVEGD